jgi:tRNA pseudouridine(55) synthase
MKLFNKPAGQTINQYMNFIKEKNGYKKICFCGRLDPMARGDILVLINEECKKMPEYLKADKIYEFEIIFGIQTHSDDPLGIIENINYNTTEDKYINKLKDLINNYACKFNQKFHNYSSKTIDGKPLWYYKKNNIKIELPLHSVEIYSKKYYDVKQYNFTQWKNKIISQINGIDKNKDFNQENIVKQWNEINMDNLISLPIELTVSSGFYIRQFVRDLSNDLQYPLLTYDINRKRLII